MDGIRVLNLAVGTTDDTNIPLSSNFAAVQSPVNQHLGDFTYGTPDPARESPFRSPPISLFVGPENTHFYVHRDILAKHSNYWRYDLQPCERPGEEFFGRDSESYIGLSLQNEDPNIVALFLELIYSKKYEYTIPHFPESSEQEIFVHAELYLFGEKYGVPKLQNFAIKQVHRLLVGYHVARYSSYATRLEFPDRLELIQKTYENTTSPKDALRMLLAMDFSMRWDIYRQEGLRDGYVDENSELGKLFHAVPRFERDLLMQLGGSPLETLPSPAVVMDNTTFPIPDFSRP